MRVDVDVDEQCSVRAFRDTAVNCIENGEKREATVGGFGPRAGRRANGPRDEMTWRALPASAASLRSRRRRARAQSSERLLEASDSTRSGLFSAYFCECSTCFPVLFLIASFSLALRILDWYYCMYVRTYSTTTLNAV